MQNDTEIIARVLSGDTEAYRLLVERYERPIAGMVRHLAWHAADIPDLAQEVFVTAYEKLATFDSRRSQFSTWLFTIARRKTLNANRRRHVQARAPLPSTPADHQNLWKTPRENWSASLSS